jgi:opacity protein-like surface antigen
MREIKMKKLVLTMLSASAFATAAFAGSYSDESNTAEYAPEYVNEQAAADNSGMYAGGAIGWTKQELSYSPSSRDEFGGQINLGYAFQINDKLFLGPEFGWGYYGQSDPANLETKALDLVVAAQYYVKEKFDVIGKVGAAVTTVTADNDYSEDYTRAMAGVGAGYDVMPQLNLNVMYYKIFGEENDGDDTNSVFAGATYRF